MKGNVEELIRLGRQIFDKRLPVMSLWQEIADNFYPERADFTASRSLGTDFASNLTTSYPILARRDLGNAFSAMLRPTAKDWFSIKADRFETHKLQSDSQAWLDHSTKIQRKLMITKNTSFIKATKQGDHDFAAFGQTAISVEINRDLNGLLYRCWHLRDVAWMCDENDNIDTIYRRWKPTARDIVKLWPKTAHSTVRDSIDKEPFKEFEVWHIISPNKDYTKNRPKYTSYYIDVGNKHEMECTGSWTMHYCIPRWQTVSGSQYAYSPATITALPDARLIQAMTAVLLESGERAVNPPMIAVQDAIKSDISVYPGGMTYVDADYDERLGDVLRPITSANANFPVGFNLSVDTREMIKEAFYLSKLTLPQPGRDMTAFEVGQRVQEYIRQAMPIFEPMETEYNGALCEMTFELLLRFGAFGPMQNIPAELQGEDLSFVFESPLHEAVERAKGQVFLESKSLLAEAAAIEPGARHMVDVKGAMRDVLSGIGTPAEWIRSKGEVDNMINADAQQVENQQKMAAMESMTKSAQSAGISAKDFINPNV
jgi:hypothetical protein